MPEQWTPEIDGRVGCYANGLTAGDAIADVRTWVDEWSYDEDPHGYCHQRSLLIALLAELAEERKQTALRDAVVEAARDDDDRLCEDCGVMSGYTTRLLRLIDALDAGAAMGGEGSNG